MQLCKYDLIRELGELGVSKIRAEDWERERVTGKRSGRLRLAAVMMPKQPIGEEDGGSLEKLVRNAGLRPSRRFGSQRE
jgi:hypothetical protein